MADCIFLYVYWREIRAFFKGQTKYVTPFSSGASSQEPASSPADDRRDSQTLAPDALESLKGSGGGSSSSDVIVGQKKIFTTDQVPPPAIKIYVNTVRRLASPQPPTPTRPAYKVASPSASVMKGRTPPSPMSPRTPPSPAVSPPAATVIEMGGAGSPINEPGMPKSPPQSQQPPPATQLDKPTKTTTLPAEQDPYRLPKTATGEPLKRHESTGSDYFKQMMRGRRPVASISQYAQLKPFKDKDSGKERRDSGRRRHGGAGSKDKKAPDDSNKRGPHKDRKPHNNKKK